MSHSTNIRGLEFKTGFVEGFEEQNSNLIVGGQAQHVGLVVKYLSCPFNQTGDVDCMFKIRPDVDPFIVQNLMPSGVKLHDPNFVILPDDNLFFELITLKGNVIHKTTEAKKLSYIAEKLNFHSDIMHGLTDLVPPTTGRYVIVVVFNEADHVCVHSHFVKESISRQQIGTTVFASYAIITSWKLYVQNRVKDTMIEKIAENVKRESALRMLKKQMSIEDVVIFSELSVDIVTEIASSLSSELDNKVI